MLPEQGDTAVLRYVDLPSECGHTQAGPTRQEIDGCPEIIVRACAECGTPLWWNVYRWRRVA